MEPVLLHHDWIFKNLFLTISQTHCTVLCFITEELRHRRAVNSVHWLFFFQLENSWCWLFIYLQHYFFLVDFHSFLNIQIYKTVPGCLKRWEQFTRGALKSGKFFCLICLVAFVANDTRVLWTGVIIFPSELWCGSFGDDGAPQRLHFDTLKQNFLAWAKGWHMGICQNFATETAGLCF